MITAGAQDPSIADSAPETIREGRGGGRANSLTYVIVYVTGGMAFEACGPERGYSFLPFVLKKENSNGRVCARDWDL